jgi:hypothetical protein
VAIPRHKSHVPSHAIAALAAIALSACAFSPLAHRIKVGEEPFALFVGEGRDGHTDLFVVPASSGPVTQLTFTAQVEMKPRLTATGEVVAFLRMRDTMPDQHRDVVIVNLLSYAELVVPMPDSAGQPTTVAWSDDAQSLFIRTDRGVWQTAAPPFPLSVTRVAQAATASADSALDLWLGRPRFSKVVDCTSHGVCVVGPKGDTATLSADGFGAMRWGNDSVAWFQKSGIAVRSLGPSHERLVTWRDGPAHPREGTFARGATPPTP